VAKLIYAAIASLDGFVADERGDFAWSAPDEEVHAFVNDVERPVGTQLLGRRMYDVLSVWEEPEKFIGDSAAMRDFAAIWKASEKVVYSRTLESAPTARTRIERDFDPGAVRQMKLEAERDLSIGGSELAAQALSAGLVDELHLFLNPIVVGAGNRALPDTVRLNLELLDEHRFSGGVVGLHYRVAN